MSGFLLDTNCISESIRKRPESRVVSWLRAVDESLLYLSVLTLGEIRKGAAMFPDSKRRAHLETWLESDLRVRFAERILGVDAEIADRWGLLTAQAQHKGRPLAAVDGLIAATALEHNLTIVSRNVSDFDGTDVPVFNPWEA
ncbi:MAG TPA: type II toxin-antitoxin system VapC family toxin [Candidatus Sulfotelmatobacter sp.]